MALAYSSNQGRGLQQQQQQKHQPSERREAWDDSVDIRNWRSSGLILQYDQKSPAVSFNLHWLCWKQKKVNKLQVEY